MLKSLYCWPRKSYRQISERRSLPRDWVIWVGISVYVRCMIDFLSGKQNFPWWKVSNRHVRWSCRSSRSCWIRTRRKWPGYSGSCSVGACWILPGWSTGSHRKRRSRSIWFCLPRLALPRRTWKTWRSSGCHLPSLGSGRPLMPLYYDIARRSFQCWHDIRSRNILSRKGLAGKPHRWRVREKERVPLSWLSPFLWQQ